MSSEARGALLGAEKLDAPKRTVFDLLKPADRERLKKLADVSAEETRRRAEAAEASSNLEKEQKKLSLNDFLKELDGSTASAALKGFMPFSNDEEKLHRYQTFLTLASSHETSGEMDYPSDFSQSARIAEWREFVAAAQIFRPMSSAMASRFTSSTASSKEIGAKTVTGLMDAASLRKANAALNLSKEEEEAQKRQFESKSAAAMGLFGQLTRTTQDWAPERLLCRRFGVNDPWAGRTINPLAPSETKVTKALGQFESKVAPKEEKKQKQQRTEPSDDPFFGVAQDVKERELAIEKEMMKPREDIDFFKAIFGDDDDTLSSDED